MYRTKWIVVIIGILFATFGWSQPVMHSLGGPVGGNVTAFAICPVDNSIYTGCSSAGVFRSLDSGLTWQDCGITNEQYDIMVIPDTNVIVYLNQSQICRFNTTTHILRTFDYDQTALVLDSNRIFTGSRQNGVQEFITYGLIPRNVGLPANARITALASDGHGRLIAGVSNQGLYRSLDTGLSWQSTTFNSNTFISAQIYHDTIYASTMDAIYESVDFGNNWITLYNEIGSFPKLKLSPGGRLFASSGFIYQIDTVTHSAQTIMPYAVSDFIAISDSSILAGQFFQGVNRTTDLGMNWSYHNAGLVASAPLNLLYYNHQLLVGLLWDYTSRWSADSGWNTCNTGSFKCMIALGNRIIAGRNPGIVYSDDGNLWVESRIDNSGTINSIVAIDSMTLMAGTYNTGTYISTDRGANWTQTTPVLPNIKALVTTVTGIIYAGTENGLYRSPDLGQSWTLIYPADTGYLIRMDNGYLFAGNGSYSSDYGLKRSTDNGATWSYVTSFRRPGMGCFAKDRYDNLYLGVGTDNSVLHNEFIYKSTNYGTSWTRIPAVTPYNQVNQNVNALAFDDDGYIYAAVSGLGVYRSSESVVSVSEDDIVMLPTNPGLAAYPNPTNGSVTIRTSFSLPTKYTLSVYNSLGQLVCTPPHSSLPGLGNTIHLPLDQLSSGTYFIQMQTPSGNYTKRVQLLK